MPQRDAGLTPGGVWGLSGRMDNMKNILSVDFSNNDDLRALVSGWSVGQEYDLRLKLQLNEMTADGAKFSIKEVTSEEPDAEEPTEVTPDNTSPVMAVMSAGPSGEKEPYIAP